MHAARARVGDTHGLGGLCGGILEDHRREVIAREARLAGQPQALRGAGFVITGDVTEFGRKETGDVQLFGILGRGKAPVAYAKVALNVVDIRTSEVRFTAQGAGEYALSSREVVGSPKYEAD